MRFTSQRRDRVTFFVVLVSVFIANLAYNMLTAALPAIMSNFNIDAISGQPLTTGYVYAPGGVSAMVGFLYHAIQHSSSFWLRWVFSLRAALLLFCAQSYPV